MNNYRRKKLLEVVALLDRVSDLVEMESPAAPSILENARDIVDEMLIEEQEAFDNLSEGLQSSDRGSVFEEAIGYLESALESLNDCVTQFDLFEAHYDEIRQNVEDAANVG